MDRNQKEIERRTTLALSRIKRGRSSSVSLFVSHHLAELDAAYWEERTGTPKPDAKQVLELLQLRSHWSPEDEDGIEIFDFTLPGEVTNYVISVQFDEEGNIQGIEMES
jgi:hypothetical protein